MPGASRSIVINAPMEKVFALITHYEAYKDFIPEVRAVRIVERTGDTVVAEYEADIVKRIKYTLRHQAHPPDRVSWTFVKGEFMKDNQGGWKLESEGEGRTKATYTIDVSVGPLVPKAVVNALVDTSLPKLLENFKQRAEQA